MCGICGVVGGVPAEAAEAAVRRMMAALSHRGPDDEGLWATPLVALGMRRLSIIDLEGGHQPIGNEDGSVTAVLNGEIYNFQELRRALEAQGHVFRTRSDSETLVHAYEAWGVDCVQHLRGMFAFAVVETPKDSRGRGARVLLARDRLGIKPLYYAVADGTLLFASEVRALVASGFLSRQLSPAALESYLLFGSVGEPTTLMEGVRSLPPGHRIFLRDPQRPGNARPEPYWRLTQTGSPPRAAKSESDDRRARAARLRSVLEESVRLHLIADVPLGVFLSSGVDSTALAALASRERAGIHTFTVAFHEEEFSEAAPARRIAQRLGTTHQELLLGGDEMLARLEEAVAALDQPSMDGINTYFVSRAARQAGLKVTLSGLGGDELFGGYSTFRSTPRLKRLAALAGRVPRPLRAAAATALAQLGARVGRGDAARKAAAAWQNPAALPHPYFFTRALFLPTQVSALLDGAGGALRRDQPWWAWLEEAARQAEPFDPFTGVTWLESRSYLVNTLLRDTDSMSMAHSLEVRVPFLDHPLLEFVAQTPEPAKRRRGVAKPLLVEALRDLLPEEVITQRKRTFTLPWARWLRGELRARVSAGLGDLSPALRAVMNGEQVQAVWRAFLAGQTSWSRPWSLYVLNEWARRHLGGRG